MLLNVSTQLEMDTDAEIEDMKRNNDKTIDAKRDEYLQLKGENGITKNKFATLQKDIEEKTAEALALERHTQGLTTEILNQQARTAALRDEIRQRDDTIGDKEHQIYELKKQNQELEKYKFVLDHKIRVLKSNIEPKAKKILLAKKTIKEMDAELEHFHHNNNELVNTIATLKDEIDTRQHEIHVLKNSLKDNETYRSRVRTDFCELASLVQDPDALRVAVAKLYEKHIASTEGVRVVDLPENMKMEYERQKNYLDKTVESLRRKLAHNSDQHRVNLTQTMSENVTLIQEIAELRREIKTLRTNPGVSESGTPIPADTAVSKASGIATPLSSAAENDVLLEIENNRVEIGRLKDMAGDLEASLKSLMARPSSGGHRHSFDAADV